MAKLIHKRYELISETLSDSEGFRRWLAQDHRSPDEPLVQIKLFPASKCPDLIHSIFEARAKELGRLSNSALAPLLDYGYDGAAAMYFLVYEHVPGKQLSACLKSAPMSFSWCLDVLMEICDALSYLHARGVTYGVPDWLSVS